MSSKQDKHSETRKTLEKAPNKLNTHTNTPSFLHQSNRESLFSFERSTLSDGGKKNIAYQIKIEVFLPEQQQIKGQKN